MTIAAGFKFSDGILLCADSQYSFGGVAKIEGSKVGAFSLPNDINVGFVFAGDVGHATTGIREILDSIADHNARTSREVVDAAQVGHTTAYERVLRHPKYGTDGSPEYQLLIGIWIKGEGLELLASSDDVVNIVPQFECFGTGQYLFRYLMDASYRENLSLEQIVFLCAHAFEEIKAFDPNVGFNTELLRIDRFTGDISEIAGYDIGHVENFGRLLKRSMLDLAFAMANLKTSDADLVRAKTLFEDNLSNLRRSYFQDKKHRNALSRLLEILRTPGEHRIKLTLPRDHEQER